MLWCLFFSLVVGNLVHVVIGAAVAPTASTKDGEPTIVRRDGDIPTITMGDVSQYANYEGNDTVEKRSVAIFPTGVFDEVPQDGVHVVFSPEMQSDMDKVLNDKCKDSRKMDECQKELAKLLQESSLNLHTKRFVLLTAFTVAEIFNNLVAAAVGAIAGLGIGTGINSLKAPASVNFADTGDYGALAQLNAYTNASAIAIATGEDNSIMATVSVATAAPTPTSWPNETVQIEEVTQNNGNDTKGDILIKIPEVTADRLLDFLGMWGLDRAKEACKASQRKQRDRSPLNSRAPPSISAQCQQALAQLAGATLAATHDVLTQLVPANRFNPFNPANPANNADGAAAPNINFGEIPMVEYLLRAFFGGQNPGPNLVNDFFMRAAIILGIVWGAAMDAAIRTNYIFTIQVAQEMVTKVKPKDILSCQRDLFCVSDDCKGTVKVGPIIPLFQGKEDYQIGYCTKDPNNRCPCQEVDEPIVYEVEGDDYFSALQQWLEDLSGSGLRTSCDSDNKIKVDPKKFKDSIGRACNNHNGLKRLKKRNLAGWDWDSLDSDHFQWSFDWNDQSEQCNMTCEDVFETFEKDDKCVWNDGMSKSGFVQTDCGIASYSVDNPTPANCWQWEFGAPRGQKEVDHEGGEGLSVENAIEQFCNDIDGQKVLHDKDDSKNSHKRRFGYSEWGVKDRRSFWLKAKYAYRAGCQDYEWPHKTNCKAVLKQAMEQCTPGQGRTGGLVVNGIGCIDYSISVTDDVHDENPPPQIPIPMWPPAYSTRMANGKDYNKPQCSKGQPTRTLTDDDLNAAIDAFCVDGREIKGFGRNHENMFDYPPNGQRQFYPGRHPYHLTMGATTVNQGDKPPPYQDMNWCKNYDWKLGKDDCTFALRKLHHDCRNDKGELLGGDFTYRCVHYKSWGVNNG